MACTSSGVACWFRNGLILLRLNEQGTTRRLRLHDHSQLIINHEICLGRSKKQGVDVDVNGLVGQENQELRLNKVQFGGGGPGEVVYMGKQPQH